MIYRLIMLICLSYSLSQGFSLTVYNQSNSTIDVSFQTYSKLPSLRELICYVHDLEPGQSGSCAMPSNRCLGAVYIQEANTGKRLQTYQFDPTALDICANFSFVVGERSGQFVLRRG